MQIKAKPPLILLEDEEIILQINLIKSIYKNKV